ncbi:MAG: ABC transporter permease subunit [Candidatus Izemoplasmatales bacterium]
MAKITLTNGKIVYKPHNKSWIVLVVIGGLTVLFAYLVSLDSIGIQFHPEELPVILKKLFSPHRGEDWGDYFAYILKLQNVMVTTLQMCYGGTVIGALFAVPFSLLSSKNIVKTKWIYTPFRFLLNLFRTIPIPVLAAICISFVGTGILAGLFAIALFTFGIMVKMLYELIETIDMNIVEALESTGANKLQAIRYAVFPQVFPDYVGYAIYILETNIRSSAILSYVGISSIGTVMKDSEMTDYDKVGGAIILIFIICVIIQLFSDVVRRKLA